MRARTKSGPRATNGGCYWWRSPVRFMALACCLCIVLGLSLTNATATSNTKQEDGQTLLAKSPPTTSGQQAANRTRARISLKSESFDLDSEEEDLKKLLGGDGPDDQQTPKFKAGGSKSGRRLSNIWSMFLPGASSETAADDTSDYSDSESVDGAQATTTTTTTSGSKVEQQNTTAATTPAPSGGGGESLVASQSSGSQRVWSAASAAANSSAALSARDNATAAGESDLAQPVRLITGALSSNSAANQTNGDSLLMSMPNMNEITSNIMGSLGASSSERETVCDQLESLSAAGAANTTGGGNFERWLSRINGTSEQLPQAAVTRLASAARQRPGADDHTTGPPKTAWQQQRNVSAKRPPKSPMQQQQQQQAHSVENERPLAPHPHQSVKGASGGIKGFPKRAAHQQQQRYQAHPFQQQQHQLVHGIKQPHSQAASTISVSNSAPDGASNTSLSFGSHYIPQLTAGAQQETSQVVGLGTSGFNNQQLNNHNVQGSGQWTLASNSKAESNGSEPASGNNGQANQSQDEILRQVTSAINFEREQQQQQLMMMSQQKRESAAAANIEQLKSTSSSPDEGNYVTPDGAMRLLAKSSSNQTSTTTTSSPLDNMLRAIGSFNNQSSNNSNNNNLASSGDIDKNFDLLAEKVRQLAGQQQQLQQQQQTQQQQLMQSNSGDNSNQQQQPSWLRHKQLAKALASSGSGASAPGKVDLQELLMMKQSSANLTNLLAAGASGAVGGGGGAATNLQQQQVDQIRELLQRHEKTKSELKSSQESMMALMRQMMQLKAGANSTSGVVAPAQVPNQPVTGGEPSGNYEHPKEVNLLANGDTDISNLAQSSHPPPLPGDVSNIGWMPVNQAGGVAGLHANPAPSSPANLMKNRIRFPQQQQPRPQHQHPQNLGFVLNSNQQQQQQVELDQRIIGLPIALLNNNSDELELSHDQLEDAARLAAEQLGAIPPAAAAPVRQQRPSARDKFAPRLEPNNGQNQQAAAQSRLQSSDQQQQQQQNLQHVQRFLQANSPQTFTAANNARALAQLQRLANLQQQQLDGNGNHQLPQRQQNLMQLERLASLLPPPPPSDDSNTGLANMDESAPSQGGDLTSNQSSSSNGEHPKQFGEAKVGSMNASSAAGQQLSQQGSSKQQQQQQSGGSPSHSQASGNFQRQAQQQQQRQVVAEYGQIPRPGSESLLRDPRPHLDGGAYLRPMTFGLDGQQQQPGARQLYDEPPPPPSYAPDYMGVPAGPPLKLREMSFYRPFGFRTHHSISYQASPAMAAIFPRFVAQPEPGGLAAGSQQAAGRLRGASDAALIPTLPLMSARPGILRHMTPIRATLTGGGQRLISQMLPHHRHHHHQPHNLDGRFHYQPLGYPTHDHLGQTLPIPPMRHAMLAAAGQPMRRRHSAGDSAPNQSLAQQRRQWPPPPPPQQSKGLEATKQMISSSRVRTRHMEPERQELVVYSPSSSSSSSSSGENDDDDDESLNQLLLGEQINDSDDREQLGLVADMPQGALENVRVRQHHTRQMRAKPDSAAAAADQQRATLRVDKPSRVLMKLPCISTAQNSTQTPINIATTLAPHHSDHTSTTTVGPRTKIVESHHSSSSTTTSTPATTTPVAV